MNTPLSIANQPVSNGTPFRLHLAIAGCTLALLGAAMWLDQSGDRTNAGSESMALRAQHHSMRQATEVDQCRSDPASCVSLGSRILSHEATRAAHLFHAACEAGHPLGCNDLGVLYRDGIGLPQDPVRAARYFERACADDSGEACNNLGVLKQRGLGTNLDSARARALYRQACELGDARGCQNANALTNALTQSWAGARRLASVPPQQRLCTLRGAPELPRALSSQ